MPRPAPVSSLRFLPLRGTSPQSGKGGLALSKKKMNGQLLPLCLVFLSSGAIYVTIFYQAFQSLSFPLNLIVLAAELAVSLFLTTIIHELGHLVFGLLTGYRFSSFNIWGFILSRDGDGFHLGRMHVTGIGGQCLLIPPEPGDGKPPALLCNMGGVLMNLAAAFLALLAARLLPAGPEAGALRVFAGVNIASSFENGIPLRTDMAVNDGYNTLCLLRCPQAAPAFQMQLRIMEMVSRGVRLRDMPEEWFTLPDEELLGVCPVAALGVYRFNRLVDAHQFEEARQLGQYLLAHADGMAGLHRYGTVCDLMYLELVGQNRREVLAGMYDGSQKRFMRSMSDNLSVLRTEYAGALLQEHSPGRAEKLRREFDAQASRFPYPSEAESERELMDLALTAWEQRTVQEERGIVPKNEAVPAGNGPG